MLIFIWLIGSGFAYGLVCMKDKGNIKTHLIHILLSILIWPVLLGIYISDH